MRPNQTFETVALRAVAWLGISGLVVLLALILPLPAALLTWAW